MEGLTALTVEIEGFVRAEQTGCHPTSGRWSRSTLQREANRRLASQYANDVSVNFLGHLHAYERAFGHSASVQLRELVVAVSDSKFGSRDPIERQLDLS